MKRSENRENKQQMLIWIDKDIVKKIKHLGVERDSSATHIVVEAVKEYLEKEENKKN